jgi:hypothetical protein
MVVVDLRSPVSRCVMCAWFNEWHRFGERDQLSLSYVLLAMGLTPLSTPQEEPEEEYSNNDDGGAGTRRRRASRRASTQRGVYLWPRSEHWHFKPPKRLPDQPKTKRPRPYVKYMGHGGCDAAGRGTNLGCKPPPPGVKPLQLPTHHSKRGTVAKTKGG